MQKYKGKGYPLTERSIYIISYQVLEKYSIACVEAFSLFFPTKEEAFKLSMFCYPYWFQYIQSIIQLGQYEGLW
jgi:hypothetical protein